MDYFSVSEETTQQYYQKDQCKSIIQLGNGYDAIFNLDILQMFSNLKEALIFNCVCYGTIQNKELTITFVNCGYSEAEVSVKNVIIEQNSESDYEELIEQFKL